ncbi:hypothetical protein KIN20_005232 [Parelaphostrongylus tenuis]|uniref:Uncharacterized protein n=1 Tax=Parelaphostrongylus tenuis TaxID=148309 RepID=A0AAD5MKY8_PARTN|nr:hypothetical protein KIN20_005232 [Parelaphostrongylus tenuis]
MRGMCTDFRQSRIVVIDWICIRKVEGMAPQAKAEETNRNEQQVEVVPIPPFPQPFYGQKDPDDEVDGKFRKFVGETFRTLIHYRTKRFQSNSTELQKRGMKEMRESLRKERIRLSVSDTGGDL